MSRWPRLQVYLTCQECQLVPSFQPWLAKPYRTVPTSSSASWITWTVCIGSKLFRKYFRVSTSQHNRVSICNLWLCTLSLYVLSLMIRWNAFTPDSLSQSCDNSLGIVFSRTSIKTIDDILSVQIYCNIYCVKPISNYSIPVIQYFSHCDKSSSDLP